MLKSAAAQSVAAVAAAALVAGLLASLAAAVPKAEAGIEGATQTSHAKAGGLPQHETGSACSSRSWPNYDAACRFDRRRPANETQTARRVIALR